MVGDNPAIGRTDVEPLRTGQVNHDHDAGINPPVPGFELVKTSDPGDGSPVGPGSPIHYTLTGTNTGTGAALVATGAAALVIARARRTGHQGDSNWSRGSGRVPGEGTDLGHERIKHRLVLGGLINEYERVT